MQNEEAGADCTARGEVDTAGEEGKQRKIEFLVKKMQNEEAGADCTEGEKGDTAGEEGKQRKIKG